MAITLNGTTGITTPTYGGSVPSEYITPVTGFKNRIINGAMTIDQRNAGALINPAIANYTVDRWQYYQSQTSKGSMGQNAGAITPPTGFTNYLGFTSSSAYSITATDQFFIRQKIEGFNISDLGWGTVNAKTVTLSFWVYSSLTGTFGGALQNSGSDRNYPFTYTISSANTWEQKTVTIAGDTTGTWLTDNGRGISLVFSLGTGSTYSETAGAWSSSSFVTSATGATSVVGTNGATFYITGVQLEVGDTATSFDNRSIGQELSLCQRYFEKLNGIVYGSYIGSFGASYSTWFFSTEKRTAPTMNFVGTTGTPQNVSTQSADVFATSTYPRIGAGTTASSEL